jgi:hypothetical protein
MDSCSVDTAALRACARALSELAAAMAASRAPALPAEPRWTSSAVELTLPPWPDLSGRFTETADDYDRADTLAAGRLRALR